MMDNQSLDQCSIFSWQVKKGSLVLLLLSSRETAVSVLERSHLNTGAVCYGFYHDLSLCCCCFDARLKI